MEVSSLLSSLIILRIGRASCRMVGGSPLLLVRIFSSKTKKGTEMRVIPVPYFFSIRYISIRYVQSAVVTCCEILVQMSSALFT